jgi:hypothetical protein
VVVSFYFRVETIKLPTILEIGKPRDEMPRETMQREFCVFLFLEMDPFTEDD